MAGWRSILGADPIPALLKAGDEALSFFTRRDLLGEKTGRADRLWDLPDAQRILERQRPDGSWPRKGPVKSPAVGYGLIETWRFLRVLVHQFGFTRRHPGAEKGAEYIFTCQTEAGDFRGFLANQYATYYTGALLGLLLDAGYARDPRTAKAFRWLLSMRQDDGGWTVPILTRDLDGKTTHRLTSTMAKPLEPDRSRPFSHNWTGMVLRAFAAHPTRRRSRAALGAGRLLASRFFQPDVYTSYQDARYWTRFDYPFWWNHLVAAMDSLSRMGFTLENKSMERGAAWMIKNQQRDGLWIAENDPSKKPKRTTPKTRAQSLWITLAVCRVLRRLFGT